MNMSTHWCELLLAVLCCTKMQDIAPRQGTIDFATEVGIFCLHEGVSCYIVFESTGFSQNLEAPPYHFKTEDTLIDFHVLDSPIVPVFQSKALFKRVIQFHLRNVTEKMWVKAPDLLSIRNTNPSPSNLELH
jgi:hypothetical protein